MTLDEAIKHAEEVAEEKENEVQDLEYSKLDWKHEANQCSKCAEEHRQLAGWLIELKEYKEQEPCEDVISRQAMIEVLNKMDRYVADELTLCNTERKFPRNEVFIVDDVYEEIAEQLPSVTPQPKIGEWLEKEVNSDKAIEEWQSARCSVCDKYHTTPYMYYFDNYKFCPNCGAKMEVEEI